MVNNAPQHW